MERKLGPHPGPAPAQAAARREWREDKARYDTKAAKIEDHFTAALSSLESSLAPGSTPTQIIDKRQLRIPPEEWMKMTGLTRGSSRLPGNSSLKDQIRALTDQIAKMRTHRGRPRSRLYPSSSPSIARRVSTLTARPMEDHWLATPLLRPTALNSVGSSRDQPPRDR